MEQNHLEKFLDFNINRDNIKARESSIFKVVAKLPEQTRQDNLKLLNIMSSNYERLLTSTKGFDTIIISSDGISIKCHELIISTSQIQGSAANGSAKIKIKNNFFKYYSKIIHSSLLPLKH